MGVVVGINRLAPVAQIFSAVDAAEPLANDASHAPIAHRRCVGEFAEIFYRSPTMRNFQSMNI